MTPQTPGGVAGAMVWALLGVAVLVTVVSALGVLLVDDHYRRLHLITPVTSIAGPAVGVALAVSDGFGLATATVLFTVALLGLTGAALQNAMGRVVGVHRGDVGEAAGDDGPGP